MHSAGREFQILAVGGKKLLKQTRSAGAEGWGGGGGGRGGPPPPPPPNFLPASVFLLLAILKKP